MSISIWLGESRSRLSTFGRRGALSSRGGRHTQLDGGCLVLFGVPFLVAGLAVMFFTGIRPILRVRDAQNWVETPARVVSSQVKSHSGSDSTTYRIDISYTYEWQGETQLSDRYDFSSGSSSSGYQSKQRVVREHPAGREFTAYVNPKKPGEAVINRDMNMEYYFGLGFGGLFAVVGLGVMVAGARSARKSGRGRSAAARGKAGGVPGLPAPDETDARGDVMLKPATPPWAKAVGTLFFALIWNGIISVFLHEVWTSWRQGSPNWVLTLFMIPFVLIGLGAILAFFYTLLSTFNPRVLIILGPGNPSPGKRQTLDWAFAGSTSRFQSFTLTLEGLERATYRRGTSTYTDENVFLRRTLVEIQDARDIRDGNVDLEIPPDAVPSFDAPNNKIIWRLAVHGKINFWPDVRDSFPFVLVPQTQETP